MSFLKFSSYKLKLDETVPGTKNIWLSVETELGILQNLTICTRLSLKNMFDSLLAQPLGHVSHDINQLRLNIT